jgi:hypothetical protein
MQVLRKYARALGLSGALLLVALLATNASATGSGTFWAWAVVNGETIVYNVEIPQPEVAQGHRFIDVQFAGNKPDGTSGVICEQIDVMSMVSCSAPRDAYTEVWAIVSYKDTNTGEGAMYRTSTLEISTLEAASDLTMRKLFTAYLVPNGAGLISSLEPSSIPAATPQPTAAPSSGTSGNVNDNNGNGNSNDNSSNGNDNSGSSSSNDNSGCNSNANGNSSSDNCA